jgi:NADH-quinone oxidoreductase subunit C
VGPTSPGQDLWVRVAPTPGAGRPSLRDKARLRFFDFLSAIDWLPSPYGRDDGRRRRPPRSRRRRPTGAEIDQGYAGGDTRFQVLRPGPVDVTPTSASPQGRRPDDDPRMPTWVRVYAGADWHEREAWEMFGITFDGHPDLRNLYLPGDFEGHPLRKDFPLLARVVKPWPGIVDVEPMPGDDDDGGDPPAAAPTEGRRMTAITEAQQLAYIAAQAADARSTSSSRPRA